MGNCLASVESSDEDQTKPGSAAAKAEIPTEDTRNYTPAHYSGDIDDFRHNRYNDVDIFTYNEMKAATMNFKSDQILGEGGFGIVYKGVIDEYVRHGYKSTEVAIKELNPESFQGNREWQAEVNYLGQLSHPNLVKLIGYCCEDEHRLLVYEYMACGSLEEHLFRRVSETMPWSTRMMIALGAAKGLAFLHESKRPIIYRDFKTSNILLDSNYNAKLSDFGLAKDGPMGDQTHVSTRVMGTYGYAAPEYVMTGHLTARSDVYGFGVVLLEMLAGKRALDKSRPSREHNLVEWARPHLLHRKKVLKIIMDPRMQGQYTAKSAQKIAHLAYQCLSRNPKCRPIMSNVVEILMNFQTHSPLPNGGVSLYEAPKSPPGKVDGEVRHLPVKSRGVGDRKGNAARSRRTRRELGRSKSEPHLEIELHGLSPDLRTAEFEQWKKQDLRRDF